MSYKSRDDGQVTARPGNLRRRRRRRLIGIVLGVIVVLVGVAVVLAPAIASSMLPGIVHDAARGKINGYIAGLRTSRDFVATNREYFNRARQAVMAKITENPAAAEALKVTKSPLLTASAGNVPDFNEASR